MTFRGLFWNLFSWRSEQTYHSQVRLVELLFILLTTKYDEIQIYWSSFSARMALPHQPTYSWADSPQGFPRRAGTTATSRRHQPLLVMILGAAARHSCHLCAPGPYGLSAGFLISLRHRNHMARVSYLQLYKEEGALRIRLVFLLRCLCTGLSHM